MAKIVNALFPKHPLRAADIELLEADPLPPFSEEELAAAVSTLKITKPPAQTECLPKCSS